jgi:hypothetical protein
MTKPPIAELRARLTGLLPSARQKIADVTRHGNGGYVAIGTDELQTFLDCAEAYPDLADKVERYERDLLEISNWSQELQDRTVKEDLELMQWRGCVAIAVKALAPEPQKES